MECRDNEHVSPTQYFTYFRLYKINFNSERDDDVTAAVSSTNCRSRIRGVAQNMSHCHLIGHLF